VIDFKAYKWSCQVTTLFRSGNLLAAIVEDLHTLDNAQELPSRGHKYHPDFLNGPLFLPSYQCGATEHSHFPSNTNTVPDSIKVKINVV
jgi:hypothetical protein